MSTTYDTSRAGTTDALEYWTQTVCDQIVPVRIDPRGVDQLSRTAMRCTGLGALQVREVVGGEHVYERGRAEIRAGDPGTLQVGMQLAGNSLLVQDGREAVLGAGDVVLYDSSRPFSLVMDARFHWQVFLLPKDVLRRSDREIARLTAVRIDGGTGIAAVVGRFLRDIVACAEELGADRTAGVLGQNAADLVSSLVTSELGQRWEVSDPARSLVVAADVFIDAHLSDPSLNPERVAHAISLSVRRLHQLFEATGSTVGEHIRDRRLASVCRDLEDPRLAGRSIARVAAGWGWSNPSAFARHFRQATGMTPTQFRERAAGR